MIDNKYTRRRCKTKSSTIRYLGIVLKRWRKHMLYFHGTFCLFFSPRSYKENHPVGLMKREEREDVREEDGKTKK